MNRPLSPAAPTNVIVARGCLRGGFLGHRYWANAQSLGAIAAMVRPYRSISFG